MGSVFWIQVPVRSGKIPVAVTGVDITETSTGGDLAIEDVVVKVHATAGLGVAGNPALSTFRLLCDNVSGTTAIFADILSNLVTGRTVDLATARGRTANSATLDAPNTPTVLEKGKKLLVHNLGAAGTSTGTVTVCVKFRRLASDADIIAKELVA